MSQWVNKTKAKYHQWKLAFKLFWSPDPLKEFGKTTEHTRTHAHAHSHIHTSLLHFQYSIQVFCSHLSRYKGCNFLCTTNMTWIHCCITVIHNRRIWYPFTIHVWICMKRPYLNSQSGEFFFLLEITQPFHILFLMPYLFRLNNLVLLMSDLSTTTTKWVVYDFLISLTIK